jgi:hypothetical protein
MGDASKEDVKLSLFETRTARPITSAFGIGASDLEGAARSCEDGEGTDCGAAAVGLAVLNFGDLADNGPYLGIWSARR